MTLDNRPHMLGDRYELGGLVGRGGMAEVHIGRDTRLGREVAIKILRADLAREATFQTRFRREAQAAAALNHPSIVAVYDTGEDPAGPTPYIVMEFVEGHTLREILKAEGRLMPRRAMEVTADICAALDFSHRNGIVHRDMKPGNVMITRGGGVKVMDFGIARAVTDTAATVTSTAQVIGTAQYLSPEQARGENVDARSDVYSTGCLLFELLTGNPPFTGDSPVAVAYQHVREDPPSPSSLNPDVPEVLDAIVLKAMAKNPMNRYQSAAEMRADLNRALAGQPVLAEPVLTADERTTLLEPTGDGEEEDSGASRKRKAAYAALIVAVLAVIIGGAITAMSLMGDDKPKQALIPLVQGQTEQAARNALKQKGFRVVVKHAVSSQEQRNRVVKQQPGANTSADLRSKVTITVGQGPNTVTVPPLKGLSLQDARAALQAAHLTANTPVAQDSTQAPNTVLDSRPAQGDTVAQGGSVTLIVSTGKVAIPSVYGLTLDQAREKLNAAGFFNVNEQQTATDEVTPGHVFQQSPADGTKAPTDTAITLTIASAPVEPSTNPSGSGSPSGSASNSPSTNPSGQPSGSPSSGASGQPSNGPSGHQGGNGNGNGNG